MHQLFIFLSIFLGACAQIFMKVGATKHPDSILKLFFNPSVILGISLYGLSAILWIYAISKVQLSYAYPMVAFGYVIVFAASIFLFNETLSLQRTCGLVIIILGVIIIAKS